MNDAPSGANLAPMPDPKPVFHVFLDAALELGILSYVSLMRIIGAEVILRSLERDADRRAAIYSACTGMAEKFAAKHSLGRQVEDINVALETEDAVAERFVRKVGIEYYIETVSLEIIYQAVMSTMWMLDSSVETHRVYAARLCDALVTHGAFNGDRTRTYERILKALTIEVLFGDEVPAELRVRMVRAVDKAAKSATGMGRLSEVILDKDDGVSFAELAQHLEVTIMAEPFTHYATALGFAAARDARDSEIPPILIDGDGETSREASKPPPLPVKKDESADSSS